MICLKSETLPFLGVLFFDEQDTAMRIFGALENGRIVLSLTV